MNNINISNIIDTSWITISNYFVDNKINIDDNDDYKTKFTKFLLKYKRIIGLTLLIVLLIGYYEYYDDNNDDNNNDDNNDKKNKHCNKIQSGGASTPMFTSSTDANAYVAGKAASEKHLAKATSDKAQADAHAESTKRASMTPDDYRKEAISKRQKLKDDKRSTKAADKLSTKDAKRKKDADFYSKSAGDHAKAGLKSAKSGLKGAYNIGASGAQTVRENADWAYGLLYAIVISLAVCIVTIPSIAFFIMGLVCYVLLKNNMKTVKGL